MRAIGWALVIGAGCRDNFSDPDAQDPCDQVGYAIALRTLDCTSDDARANERYEEFAETYGCAARGEVEVSDYRCAVGVMETACPAVVGDPLDEWLAATDGCGELLPGLGGAGASGR